MPKALQVETPIERAKRLEGLMVDLAVRDAASKGERAGREYVSALVSELGTREVISRNDCGEAWDAEARRLCWHRTARVEDDFGESYYIAFEQAARDMAGGYAMAEEYAAEARGEGSL